MAVTRVEETFAEFLERAQRLPKPDRRAAQLLALDPGGTTGWAYFSRGQLIAAGQVPGEPAQIEALIATWSPRCVVMEDYRIYASKMWEHVNSRVPTTRLIGAIDYICERRGLPVHYQMAAQAKPFATDAKLRRWGLWLPGQQHARDAIRHAIYWLLCSKERNK